MGLSEMKRTFGIVLVCNRYINLKDWVQIGRVVCISAASRMIVRRGVSGLAFEYETFILSKIL